uniref:Probable prolyl 4-hydroxylase 10 n=1 Tax=Tanacetum cinerariifolium TaxID=118510 RepID=A0A699GTS8_TANCI|nr:probable prolyl 4-hydroxylase 10 [Tanacetum cinerariifolium]
MNRFRELKSSNDSKQDIQLLLMSSRHTLHSFISAVVFQDCKMIVRKSLSNQAVKSDENSVSAEEKDDKRNVYYVYEIDAPRYVPVLEHFWTEDKMRQFGLLRKKILDFTFLHVEHGEGLQILHNEVSQKYEPHYDYFLDDYNTKSEGQRMATILMYLPYILQMKELTVSSQCHFLTCKMALNRRRSRDVVWTDEELATAETVGYGIVK